MKKNNSHLFLVALLTALIPTLVFSLAEVIIIKDKTAIYADRKLQEKVGVLRINDAIPVSDKTYKGGKVLKSNYQERDVYLDASQTNYYTALKRWPQESKRWSEYPPVANENEAFYQYSGASFKFDLNNGSSGKLEQFVAGHQLGLKRYFADRDYYLKTTLFIQNTSFDAINIDLTTHGLSLGGGRELYKESFIRILSEFDVLIFSSKFNLFDDKKRSAQGLGARISVGAAGSFERFEVAVLASYDYLKGQTISTDIAGNQIRVAPIFNGLGYQLRVGYFF